MFRNKKKNSASLVKQRSTRTSGSFMGLEPLTQIGRESGEPGLANANCAACTPQRPNLSSAHRHAPPTRWAATNAPRAHHRRPRGRRPLQRPRAHGRQLHRRGRGGGCKAARAVLRSLVRPLQAAGSGVWPGGQPGGGGGDQRLNDRGSARDGGRDGLHGARGRPRRDQLPDAQVVPPRARLRVQWWPQRVRDHGVGDPAGRRAAQATGKHRERHGVRAQLSRRGALARHRAADRRQAARAVPVPPLRQWPTCPRRSRPSAPRW